MTASRHRGEQALAMRRLVRSPWGSRPLAATVLDEVDRHSHNPGMIASRSTEETRSRSSAPRPIPIRRPGFHFAGMPRYWFGGDPFLTHLMHALSLTFPGGERFFMDAVRHYETRVHSAELRHEIASFLGQESLHARAHADFNAWIRSAGFDTRSVEENIVRGLARARERPHRVQLAMTCALEHFTAMIAEVLLDSPDMQALMHPEARRLFVWHALEETEHKAVAFDTYLAIGGSYRTRVLTMLMTTVYFIVGIAMAQERLLRGDAGARGAVRLKGLVKLWVRPGWFRRLVPAYLDYFRPTFHPWDRAPRSAMEPYLRELQPAVLKP